MHFKNIYFFKQGSVLFCRNPASVSAAQALLRCGEGETLKIKDAIFGFKDHIACPTVVNETLTTANQDCDENVRSLEIVKEL
jgi:hypothetical protein